MSILYSDASDTAQTTPVAPLDLSAVPQDLKDRPTLEAPDQAQLATPIACPRCGTIDTPAVGPGSGQHFASARCRHCGAFLKWLSQYLPSERHTRRQQARLKAMVQRPPSQAQLTYLQALGDSGPPPANMVEASARIDSLKHGRVA